MFLIWLRLCSVYIPSMFTELTSRAKSLKPYMFRSSYLDHEQVDSQRSQSYGDLSLYGQLSGDVGVRQNRCRVRCSASKCKNALGEEKMHQVAKKCSSSTRDHFNYYLPIEKIGKSYTSV